MGPQCSGITGRLVADPNSGLSLAILKMESWTHMGRTANMIIKDVIHVFASISKIMRILLMGRRNRERWNYVCDSTIAARCCVACGKFIKLLPVLTTRHLSPKVRSKVSKACVFPAMFHGSKIWGPNTSDLQRPRCNNRCMIWWISGTKDWDETLSALLLQKLGIEGITVILHSQRLPGTRGQEKPSKTSSECIRLSTLKPVANDLLNDALRLDNELSALAATCSLRSVSKVQINHLGLQNPLLNRKIPWRVS